MPYTGDPEELLAEMRDAGCTKRQMEAMTMFVVDGLRQMEIAARMGIGQTMVSAHISRAMRHIRARQDAQAIPREIGHMIEQDIEEVVSRGVGDDEDTVSLWRKASLQHAF